MRTYMKHFLLTAVIGLLLAVGTPAKAGPNPVVIFDTNMGLIYVMLYPKEAPKTVANFLRYVDEGFYNGTLIHRVLDADKDFKSNTIGFLSSVPYSIIQGGGFEPGMREKPTYPPIVHEGSTALANKKWTIAMARGDNPDSARAQFFFNMDDNEVFDYAFKKDEDRKDVYTTQWGYVAFGKVIRGTDVLEEIFKVERTSMGRHKNVPVQQIMIKRAYRPQ